MFLFPLFVQDGNIRNLSSEPVFMAIAIGATLLSLFAIFQFKKRQLQVVLSRLAVILNFVVFGLMIYHYFQLKKLGETEMGMAVFFPLAAVILLVLASKAILKDEMKIRAADRFR